MDPTINYILENFACLQSKSLKLQELKYNAKNQPNSPPSKHRPL